LILKALKALDGVENPESRMNAGVQPDFPDFSLLRSF
jgi:hypothetical protein